MRTPFDSEQSGESLREAKDNPTLSAITERREVMKQRVDENAVRLGAKRREPERSEG
jgi:hypothetical protein